MTIREAMDIASSPKCDPQLHERLVKAIEAKCYEALKRVTVWSVGVDNRLQAIKSIWLHAGCELKEAVDLVDDVMAWHRLPGTGKHRHIDLPLDKAESLEEELRSFKVNVTIDDNGVHHHLPSELRLLKSVSN